MTNEEIRVALNKPYQYKPLVDGHIRVIEVENDCIRAGDHIVISIYDVMLSDLKPRERYDAISYVVSIAL